MTYPHIQTILSAIAHLDFKRRDPRAHLSAAQGRAAIPPTRSDQLHLPRHPARTTRRAHVLPETPPCARSPTQQPGSQRHPPRVVCTALRRALPVLGEEGGHRVGQDRPDGRPRRWADRLHRVDEASLSRRVRGGPGRAQSRTHEDRIASIRRRLVGDKAPGTDSIAESLARGPPASAGIRSAARAGLPVMANPRIRRSWPGRPFPSRLDRPITSC